MFALRFSPSFSKQRQALLAEKSIPALELPETVAQCVDSIRVAQPIGESSGPARRVTSGLLWKNCLRAMKPLLIRTLFFALLASLAASLSSLAGMQILEKSATLRTGLAFAGLYFFMNVLSQFAMFHSGRLRSWVGLGGEAYLAGLVAQKLVRLSARAAERQSSGNLKVLITSDVKNIGGFLDNAVRNLIPTLIALIVITPLIVHFGGLAGALSIGVMLTLIPLSIGLNLISSRLQARAQTELDGLTSLVGEWVTNIRLIRYLSWENQLENDVSLQLRRYMKFSTLQHFMACLIFGLSSSWWMVGAASVLLAARFFQGELDVSGFFGSLWLLTFLAGYLTHIPNTIRLYGIAAPSMARLAKFLEESEREEDFEKDVLASSVGRPARLRFENVSYAYPGGKTALANLNLTLELNQRTAILGEIGSGKSTLLRLITGEYPPTAGKILVEDDDGKSSSLWNRETYARYRESIGYVPQEPFVAQDRLSRNITLSDLEDREKTLQAAYYAELEADLGQLPQGLEQEIGEGGVNLSGGQRQRLNLARALYSERPCLVLDDTLSAVDQKTEAKLMRTLLDRSAGFVLVTHRLQELDRVDRVIVMRDGMAAEEGTPSALMKDPNSLFTRVLRAYETQETGGNR